MKILAITSSTLEKPAAAGFWPKENVSQSIGGRHSFFIYAGFIIINIEVLEIVLDGIIGKHRLFAGPLGGFYQFLINAFEVLALLVLLACVIFLVRRNILKLKRFMSKDLDGWPRSDANYILITEIILMTLFLTLNASDTLLQSRGIEHYAANPTGNFILSQYLHPLLNSLGNPGLEMVERGCWWLHIVGIFAFLNYLPYSKHLHIILAFPNAWYARLEPGKNGEHAFGSERSIVCNAAGINTCRRNRTT